METFVSLQGATPATIAIKNGVFRAGLHADELENLARAGEEGRAVKCSTRDLPLVASKYCYLNPKNGMISYQSSAPDENVQWGGTIVFSLP